MSLLAALSSGKSHKGIGPESPFLSRCTSVILRETGRPPTGGRIAPAASSVHLSDGPAGATRKKDRWTIKNRKSETPRPKPVPSPSGYLVPLDRTMPAIPVAAQDPKPVPPAPGWENLCKDATDAGLAGLLREIVQVRRVADRNVLPTLHLSELIHRATVMGFHLDPAPPVKYGQWHAENAAQATRSEFLRAATAILRRFADRSAAALAHRRPLLAWDECDKDDEARLLEIADALDGGKAQEGEGGQAAAGKRVVKRPAKEHKWWDGALASLKRLGTDLPGRVGVRVSEDVHDRYIYVDGNAWRSSDSFKDMAAKKTTKIIDEGNRSAELIADFEKRWSSAQQVYPP